MSDGAGRYPGSMTDGAEPTDQHMTDFEALMWNLEKDPRLSANIANLSILDRPVDLAVFRRTMERATRAFPRLRQRVAPVFGRLAPPRWEVDPDFDIDHHLRRISLGGKATRRELHELASVLASTPFDRTRPLWEFVVIDGLADGRAAMLQRLHHTITDGQGGLQLSLEFVDFTRKPKKRPAAPGAPEAERSSGGILSSVGDAVGHVTRRQIGTARRTVEHVVDSTLHPQRLVEDGVHAVELATSTVRQARVGDAPLSPLWVDRSLSRYYDTFDVPLAKAKAASLALGGTLNDFFVCGAAAAASEYHQRHGEECPSLRMAMPVSTRSDRSVGGNVFSPAQALVPTAPMSLPERFAAVHETLDRTKSEPAIGAVDAFAGLLNLMPTSVLTRTGYRFAGAIDFVTSNLRAAPMDLYLGGALMECNYPMGPLAGTSFNLTTMSYRGSFNMGVWIDTQAVTAPKELVKDLRSAYRSLLRARP